MANSTFIRGVKCDAEVNNKRTIYTWIKFQFLRFLWREQQYEYTVYEICLVLTPLSQKTPRAAWRTTPEVFPSPPHADDHRIHSNTTNNGRRPSQRFCPAFESLQRKINSDALHSRSKGKYYETYVTSPEGSRSNAKQGFYVQFVLYFPQTHKGSTNLV